MKNLTTEEQGQLELIKKELFYSDVVVFDYHEGYKYKENGVASFGLKVGPNYSISDGLLHEIGHVAELQTPDRLMQYGFGLQIKTQVFVLGKIYYEPTTWNSTKLELRSILWQEVLATHFNVKFDRNEFCTALQYMPDFLNVPMFGHKWVEDGYYNGSGVKHNGNLKEKDELRFKSMRDYMDEQNKTGTYTYQNFKTRWDKSIEFLQNHR